VGGVTYDRLDYPENFRSPPLKKGTAELEHWSPKAGFILTPHRTLTMRGAYAEAISGASFDESIRLEPTQVAGFNQAYRTIISEDLVGSVAGSVYKTWSLSLDQKLATGTYWGVELQRLEQDLERTIGVFDYLYDGAGFAQGVLPSSTREAISYREESLTATLNQLLGDEWVFGARYRYTKATLENRFDSIPTELLADRTRESLLHELALYAQYQHASGFFARGEALWFAQENDGFTAGRFARRQRGDAEPGDSFWQVNGFVGWRVWRNRGEISLGVLNLLDTDYELEPLTPYREMPRERTGILRVRLNL
jgi:outer membrane receptor protein involved in Fe transport